MMHGMYVCVRKKVKSHVARSFHNTVDRNNQGILCTDIISELLFSGKFLNASISIFSSKSLVYQKWKIIFGLNRF